ncbi:MAG: hypothetical protein KC561_18580, partial [Myxococcales bacterium]|nr:hypothetical protein [Myxococcales bacterium]
MKGDRLDQQRDIVSATIRSQVDADLELLELEPLSGGACQDNIFVRFIVTSGEFRGEHRMVIRSDAPSSLP